MKRLFVILLLGISFSYGQNLVPNPGFESMTSCPFGSYEIDKVVSWSGAGGSPDYFNSCASPGGASVPNNFMGYQDASSGSAYVGIYTYNRGVTYPNNREYIQATLNSPLSIGTQYFVSMDISFTIDPFEVGFATDKMGMLFTNVTTYDAVNPPYTNNNAQVYCDSLISDTVSWYHFEGNFIADSNYQTIVIGNLFDDVNTDILDIDTTLYTAYYYVDNICVSSNSGDCLLSASSLGSMNGGSVNVYPNPANEGYFWLSVESYALEEYKYEIVNTVGSVVQSGVLATNQNNHKLNIESLDKGIYLIRVSSGSNRITKNLIIN